MPDRVVFEKLVQVLVFSAAPTGGSLTSHVRILPLRRRRDEWILAGAMERWRELVLAAYDRTISISWYAADKETL